MVLDVIPHKANGITSLSSMSCTALWSTESSIFLCQECFIKGEVSLALDPQFVSSKGMCTVIGLLIVKVSGCGVGRGGVEMNNYFCKFFYSFLPSIVKNFC